MLLSSCCRWESKPASQCYDHTCTTNTRNVALESRPWYTGRKKHSQGGKKQKACPYSYPRSLIATLQVSGSLGLPFSLTALVSYCHPAYPATSLQEDMLIWYGLEEKGNYYLLHHRSQRTVLALGREGRLMSEAPPTDCSPGTLNSEHLRKERMVAATLLTFGQMCMWPPVCLP